MGGRQEVAGMTDNPQSDNKQIDDIIDLASMIMSHYEIPDEPDKPRQINLDGFMNLLLCRLETCEDIYRAKKSLYEHFKQEEARSVKVSEGSSDGTLDFDL